MTDRFRISEYKDSDGWYNLAYELKFDKFKEANPNLDEDALHDKFHEEVVYKYFEYGEYGTIDIIVDEDFNIVGGKILPL